MTKLSIRLAAVLIAAGLVAAACGGDDDTADGRAGAAEPGTTGEASASSTAASGGGSGDDGGCSGGDLVTEGVDRQASLRIGTFSPMTTADPHAVGATVSTTYFNLMYDRLLWVDRNSTLCPYLVTEWEFVGSALVLHLRDDATFQDGSPLDAAAVKANLERARTMETSAYLQQLQSIESIDVVDATTVQLNLIPNRGATLPYVLAGWAGMMVNPKFLDPGALKSAAPDGVGSGPYKIVSWTPGEPQVVFERAEGHWDPAAGQAARIEVYFAPDLLQQVNAVTAGQDDVALVSTTAALEAERQAQSSPDSVQIGEWTTSFSNAGLWMRDRVDPVVREAIRYAIDRETLNAVAEGGAETVNQLYPEGHAMYIEEINELHTYDPDRARELLASAPDGSTSLTMAFVDSGVTTPIVELLQVQLADVGIDLTLEPMAHSSIYQAWFEGKFDMLQAGTAGPAHVSLAIDAMLLRAGVNWGAPDAAVSEIVAELNRADDPVLGDEERNEIYRGILRRAAEESWMVVWNHNRTLPVARADMVNVMQIPFTYQSLPDFRYVAKKAG